MRKKKRSFHESSLLFCKVCDNKPPTGHCPICGLRRNPNEYVTKWASRYEFLRETYVKLKKYQMQTTGDPGLDEEVRKQFGTWLPESIFEILKRVERLLKDE